AGTPVPVREGAGELERRPRALPRDGRGVPEVTMRAPLLLPSVIDAMEASPLVALDRLSKATGVEGRILAKLDYLLPGFSKKDRAARRIIEDARASGELAPGQTVVELTSGN